MKSKRERYRVIAERDNVLEAGKPLYTAIKGRWHTLYFKNSYPIVVELACGRGEYTIGMAERFADRNFVGVDRKGDRLWKGSTLAGEKNLDRVAFLRTPILEIENFFARGEVSEIWITFPDPRPRRRDIKRRLTHARFMDKYKHILAPQGAVRLKTDNTDLFRYTLDELRQRTDVANLRFTFDLYDSDLRADGMDIETRYEKMFRARGETIKYLRFNFIHRENAPSSPSKG